MVGHAAAKAGVIAMTRQFALEGARHGIRAVAISPGPFLTPASDRDLGDNQAARDAITSKTLLKRFGQPEEIVGAGGLPRFRPGVLHHRRQLPGRRRRDRLVEPQAMPQTPTMALRTTPKTPRSARRRRPPTLLKRR